MVALLISSKRSLAGSPRTLMSPRAGLSHHSHLASCPAEHSWYPLSMNFYRLQPRFIRYIALTGILTLFLLMLPACSRAQSPELLSLDVAVRLLPDEQRLAGTAIATLLPGPEAPVVFALAPQVRVEGVRSGTSTLRHTLRDGLLTVTLPAADRERQVTIVYQGRFADQVPTRIVSFEDPTYGVSGVITPQGTYLSGDAGWYPRPAVDPHRLIVRVVAPAGMEAITEGERSAHTNNDRESSSTWTVSRPFGPLALSAGPYRIHERREGETTLYTYFLPDNEPLSDRYLDAVASYLRLYQGLFGPYPFRKFAVVENFLPTGYGFPSYTLLGSGVIRLPFILESSLPHELAHCWWGNGVHVALSGGNWCEGLATYVADYLVLERKGEREAREYRQRLINDYAALVGPGQDFPLRAFRGRADPASRAIGYGKAAMLFHMIRRTIGDEAFFKGLRSVAESRLFRTASWDDLVSAFSQAGGRDLSPFAAQWLDRPGGPELALEQVALAAGGSGWTVTGTVRQAPAYGGLNVTLALETDTGVIHRQLLLAGNSTPFALDVSARPRRLQLDPDADLFRVVPVAELPPNVNRLKGAKGLTVIVAAGQRPDEPLQTLLTSLGQGGATVVGEETLGGRLPDGDFLIYGLPGRPELLGGLPESLSLTGGGFTVGGVRYDAPGDALLLVTPHPHAAARVRGVFVPRSPEAARLAVPKITHYGRYGLLVFRGGENRYKGVGMAPPGSTSVTLTAGGAP